MQQEKAFYVSYTELLRHIVRRARDVTEVLIDDRSDEYEHQVEAMTTIGNRMLVKLTERGSIESVRKVNSHSCPGIQMADVLTGVINAGHLKHFQKIDLHPGKQLALERVSSYFGWRHLAHDTYPHPKFNVWHFPTEFRGPSQDPMRKIPVKYVTAAELRRWSASKR